MKLGAYVYKMYINFYHFERKLTKVFKKHFQLEKPVMITFM